MFAIDEDTRTRYSEMTMEGAGNLKESTKAGWVVIAAFQHKDYRIVKEESVAVVNNGDVSQHTTDKVMEVTYTMFLLGRGRDHVIDELRKSEADARGKMLEINKKAHAIKEENGCLSSTLQSLREELGYWEKENSELIAHRRKLESGTGKLRAQLSRIEEHIGKEKMRQILGGEDDEG